MFKDNLKNKQRTTQNLDGINAYNLKDTHAHFFPQNFSVLVNKYCCEDIACQVSLNDALYTYTVFGIVAVIV